MTIEDVSKAEGDTATTPFVFKVTATSTNATACDGVTIKYETADGTAKAGEDFVSTTGNLVLGDKKTADGQTTQTGTVEVPVIGDTVFEQDETFTVKLTSVDPIVKFPNDATSVTATGTIEDDDAIGADGALTRSPESGKPGTVITVSGTKCQAETVDVFLSASSGSSGGPVAEKTVTVGQDDAWTTTLTVPKGSDPDLAYFVGADCGGEAYELQSFDVLGPADGYRMVASDGGVFVFGDRNFEGSLGDRRLNKPIVGGATNPKTLAGYWMVASDGGIFNFGDDAGFYGSLGGETLTSPIVEIEPTPSGKGYFLVDSKGRVFPFGDAPKDIPDARSVNLNKSIIGMTVTPTGGGYWLVASDGGIFNFGDAPFFGSTGDRALNAPIIDLAATPDGKGYYLVGGDGGIFTFGTAAFKGSTGDRKLNKPAVAMLVSPTGAGYWIIASDGGVFTFGAVPFLGSMGHITLNSPVLDAIL